jgi:hypothetical protein
MLIVANPEMQVFNIYTWITYSNVGFLSLMVLLQIIFLWIFITEFRFIIIYEKSITFINPILPFIRTVRIWDYYDECRTVLESSKHRNYEAIWFIKDNKLKARISSNSYTNYNELKRSIKIKRITRLKIKSSRQSLIRLGASIS